MHPVNKTSFGKTGIAVSYYNTTTSATTVGYVVKQTGTYKYVVSDGVIGHANQTITLAQTAAQISALGSSENTIGTILITPYGAAGTAASSTLTFTGGAHDGDTLALGGTLITFKTSGAVAASNQVNIGGGTAAQSADNLYAFLIASTDVNIAKCTYTHTAGQTTILVTFKVVGTQGNAYGIVPTSGGRISDTGGTNLLAGGASTAVEHVKVLYDSTVETVEGHRYKWTQDTSVGGSAVIEAF
jgi:hypothetical protein